MTNREKEELTSFLIKVKLPPAVYATNQMGNQKRFICRITVKNLDYVGIGKASNKEQAESIAIRDLIAHLRYKGSIDQDTMSSCPPVIQPESSKIHDPTPDFKENKTFWFDRKPDVKKEQDSDSDSGPEFDIYADPYGPWR